MTWGKYAIPPASLLITLAQVWPWFAGVFFDAAKSSLIGLTICGPRMDARLQTSRPRGSQPSLIEISRWKAPIEVVLRDIPLTKLNYNTQILEGGEQTPRSFLMWLARFKPPNHVSPLPLSHYI
jgi:hypothetical protein